MKASGIISIIALLMFVSPLLAGEGKALYEENCTRCHNTEVFTRENRGIKNLEGLKVRVKQCTRAAEVKWTNEDIIIVADYLNRKFYRF